LKIFSGSALASFVLLLPLASAATGTEGDPPADGRGEAQITPALKLSESLSNGRLLLEVRPRYALIKESEKEYKTDVWTQRTTLGWQTAPFYDVRLTAQYIATSFIGSSERVNTNPANFYSSEYPLLPDPPHNGVNQLYADYAGLPSTRMRIGRQILRVDDQRFISDVDFRQTPQVFDGVTLINNALADTEIQLGEYRRMRTVLGGLNALRLHILHAAWNPLPDHTVAAYGYWQDQAQTGSQTGFANNAQRILGAHAEGSIPLNRDLRWMYYLAFARQNRIGDGDARINADYKRIGMGLQASGAVSWGARIDHEIKGSKTGVYAFQTPLSDFYAFNGWALQYTSTPEEGLIDTWLTGRVHIDKLDFFVEAHRFRYDFGSEAMGREIDANLVYAFTHQLSAKLQMARYRSFDRETEKNDVNKLWLSMTYVY
jgi:hypothetical protein